MKKIKNSAHLEAEKMKLRVTELELEKALRNDWKEIKEKLNPGSILKEHFREEKGKHWIVSGLNAAASFITGRILEKVEEKFEKKSAKAHS